MNRHSNHIKLANLDIPKNIWELDPEERLEIAIAVKEFMETVIRKQLGITKNKKELLKQLIESTIIVNEAEEQYEVCQVMKDIKQIIDEPIG